MLLFSKQCFYQTSILFLWLLGLNHVVKEAGAELRQAQVKLRRERGRAVLWRRCNLARLSITLPNLGFAQVTYPGAQWFPSITKRSMGISVSPSSLFPPQPILLTTRRIRTLQYGTPIWRPHRDSHSHLSPTNLNPPIASLG